MVSLPSGWNAILYVLSPFYVKDLARCQHDTCEGSCGISRSVRANRENDGPGRAMLASAR